jgi:hypothetical protein
MHLLRRLGQISAAGILFGGALVLARAQSSPNLDQILAQIAANTERYSATVPSFICNEHIVSQEIHAGKVKRETTVDAVFSVKRSASRPNVLEESREVKLIDGRPAANGKTNLPLAFSGGFSGALTKFLSSDHRSCFEYKADASKASPRGRASFVFVARSAAVQDPNCASIRPGTTGNFTVDTASMQVTHIERTAPTSVGKDKTVSGTAAVDYALVMLNDKSFWLPTTITAFTTDGFKDESVHFTANYSDYHRFAASATIVPAGQ